MICSCHSAILYFDLEFGGNFSKQRPVINEKKEYQKNLLSTKITINRKKKIMFFVLRYIFFKY